LELGQQAGKDTFKGALIFLESCFAIKFWIMIIPNQNVKKQKLCYEKRCESSIILIIAFLFPKACITNDWFILKF
jgi:hypothetical protein